MLTAEESKLKDEIMLSNAAYQILHNKLGDAVVRLLYTVWLWPLILMFTIIDNSVINRFIRSNLCSIYVWILI